MTIVSFFQTPLLESDFKVDQLVKNDRFQSHSLINKIVVRMNLGGNSVISNSHVSVLVIVQNGKLRVGKPWNLIKMHQKKTPRFSSLST